MVMEGVMEHQKLNEAAGLTTFGRRKVTPRVCIADSKQHIRTFLQAAHSNSVFGEIFSALDWLVDFSVKRFAALFEVKSFTRSWLTVGFMIVYVYLAGWVILFLAKVVIRA